MSEKTRSKGTRRFIRLEKARIRREIIDFKKQEEAIEKLYLKLSGKKDGQEVKKVGEKKKVKKAKEVKKKQAAAVDKK
ncbi:hypothetical protein BWK69_01240 [Candidatus Parcubacteria bacterium A4]|nr:MAG: hypothetical protein BWK69_01240 [Candidatus Parcubacteria bacterium A4]